MLSLRLQAAEAQRSPGLWDALCPAGLCVNMTQAQVLLLTAAGTGILFFFLMEVLLFLSPTHCALGSQMGYFGS